MSTGEALVVVIAVAVSTYLMRASLIVLLAGVEVPPSVERALRYVGPATLAALTANLAFGGEGGPNIEWVEVTALTATGAVAMWRRDLILSVVVGMVAFWLLAGLT